MDSEGGAAALEPRGAARGCAGRGGDGAAGSQGGSGAHPPVDHKPKPWEREGGLGSGFRWAGLTSGVAGGLVTSGTQDGGATHREELRNSGRPLACRSRQGP